MAEMRTIELQRGRMNGVAVHIGIPLTGMDLKAQIRTRPSEDSELVAEWEIQVIDESRGELAINVDGDKFGNHGVLYTDIVDRNSNRTLLPVVRINVTSGVTQ